MATILKELTVPHEKLHVYKDIDKIRLVYEDGQLVGWYRPRLDDNDVVAAAARIAFDVLGIALAATD